MRGGEYSNGDVWVCGPETSVRTALESCLFLTVERKNVQKVLDKQKQLIYSDSKMVSMKTKIEEYAISRTVMPE